MLRNRYLCHIIAILALTAACWGCSSDSFRVEGKIEGMGRQNLRVVYYAGGALRMIPAMVENGEFAFEGRSAEPTLVELYTTDRTLVGRFVVKNGDKIRCSFDRSNPWNVAVEGNDLSSRWADFIKQNASALSGGSVDDVNALVADYVDNHPADPLSSLLLLTTYDSATDPAGAALLLEKTDPAYRPKALLEGFEHQLAAVNDSLAAAPLKVMRVYSTHDSMTTFTPSKQGATLICLSTASSGRSDSIVKQLKALVKSAKGGNLSILDLSVDTDTATWHSSIAGDTVRWTQAWAPGGLGSSAAGPLGASRVPYFIVADSTGRQVYRGGSLSTAVETTQSILK